MILSLPLAAFLLGSITAYLRAGALRVLGTVAMLVAAAWSLSFITPWQPAAGWVVGPLLGTLLVFRPAPRNRLSFEQITRRVTTLVAAALVAIFAATKFPIGENPTLLSAVPWLLGAVGAAWVISPIDDRERAQACVLLVAAGSALLILALPVGVLTAAACGAMALLPAIAFRWSAADNGETVLRFVLLAGAGGAVAAAVFIGAPPHPSLLDLTISLDGPALAAVALLLLAGACLTGPRTWLAIPGLLAVLAVSPGLRWAALAGLLATGFQDQRREERFAWLALLLLASSTLFNVLVAQPWSPRAQIAATASSLVLATLSARASRTLSIAFVAVVLVVFENTVAASAFLMSRFQWVAAAGALLLVARALLERESEESESEKSESETSDSEESESEMSGSPLEDALVYGLLLLALAAHDTLALGALAAVLLLVDIIVRHSTSEARGDAVHQPRTVLQRLSRSGWPPTVRFAGVTLAVVASLQTSLAVGLIAAALLLGLKLAPLFRRVPRDTKRHPLWLSGYLSPALSLACGLAPALVLRILRV